MQSAAQSAIAEGLTEIESAHGFSFTYAGQRFQAWPVQVQNAAGSRIDASPDTTFMYEARSAPDFKRGEILKGSDGLSYTVAARLPFSPVLGVFRFSIHPGRPAK